MGEPATLRRGKRGAWPRAFWKGRGMAERWGCPRLRGGCARHTGVPGSGTAVPGAPKPVGNARARGSGFLGEELLTPGCPAWEWSIPCPGGAASPREQAPWDCFAPGTQLQAARGRRVVRKAREKGRVQWLLSPGFFGGLAASKPRIENQNRVRRQVLILVLNRR